MGEIEIPEDFAAEMEDSTPWYVIFTQEYGGVIEYDTNHELDMAVAMVTKGLYQLTEDALDDDYPEDEDDEDDDDEGDAESL